MKERAGGEERPAALWGPGGSGRRCCKRYQEFDKPVAECTHTHVRIKLTVGLDKLSWTRERHGTEKTSGSRLQHGRGRTLSRESPGAYPGLTS
jgi:hypothetical protein